MISIVICSRNKDIPERLKSNIEATAGVPCEIIVIDNSKQDCSIFSAYNEGIRRAAYDYLCFMHEDIWYHSENWGKSVIRHLSEPQTGLIGLAGSYYLLAIPAPWFKAKPNVKNLVQSHLDREKPPKYYTLTEDKEVVCVDGFWFCTRKNILQEAGFDEKTFTGFHFYDLDISMQIREKGYSVKVISDITVEHFSKGTLNRQWIDSAYIFYNKWENRLPLTILHQMKKKPLVNVKAYRDLLYLHKKHGCPIPVKIKEKAWKELKFNLLTAYFLFLLKWYF